MIGVALDGDYKKKSGTENGGGGGESEPRGNNFITNHFAHSILD